MNKIKEFYKTHYSQEVELEYRTFCICTLLGTFTSFIGAILCLVLTGIAQPSTFATSSCFLMMCILTYIGYKYKKIEIVIIIMSCIINLFVFPYIFLTTGALYSCVPMFFVMGCVIAAPMLSGKKRMILWLIQMIVYVGVISVCFFNEDISYLRPQHVHIMMLLFSFVLVAFYVFVSTVMVTNQYDKERKKVEKLNELLEELANQDPLTKLYNRRYLTDFLDKKVENKDSEFCIVLIDLDDFKKVNDQYGHGIGDDVLIGFANVITSLLDDGDFVCRFGGEEFMIYSDTSEEQYLKAHLEKLGNAFTTYCMEKLNIKVTFSAGVAFYKGEKQITDLFNKADIMLYEAKRQGKNCFKY